MTPIQRGALLLFAVLLLFAHPVLGQTPSLEPGTRLRVHAHGLELSGEFVRWNGDTLIVRPESGREGIRADQATAAFAIQRIDRGVPRSRGRGAARGALWGGAVGSVGGAVWGFLDPVDCDSSYLCWSSNAEVKTALLLGGVLGVLGAGVGAIAGVIHPGTAWEPVPLQEGAGR